MAATRNIRPVRGGGGATRYSRPRRRRDPPQRLAPAASPRPGPDASPCTSSDGFAHRSGPSEYPRGIPRRGCDPPSTAAADFPQVAAKGADRSAAVLFAQNQDGDRYCLRGFRGPDESGWPVGVDVRTREGLVWLFDCDFPSAEVTPLVRYARCDAFQDFSHKLDGFPAVERRLEGVKNLLALVRKADVTEENDRISPDEFGPLGALLRAVSYAHYQCL